MVRTQTSYSHLPERIMKYAIGMIPVVMLLVLAALQRTSFVALFEHLFKLSFKDAPVRSFLFFAAWSLLYIFLFPEEIAQLFSGVHFTGYLALLFVVIVVYPFIFRLLHDRVGVPSWLSAIYPSQTMLSLESQYILAKVGDVVSQQLIGGIFLYLLLDMGVGYEQIVLLFVLLFALSHLYLFATSGFIWGLHYTVYSAAAGFAIPFLVLYIDGGILYAIAAHLFFYVVSAAFFAAFPRPSKAVCMDIVHAHPTP